LLDVVGIKVEVEVGTDLLLDASRHDFPPALGDALDPGRIHQRRLAKRHRMSLLGLRAQSGLGNLG